MEHENTSEEKKDESTPTKASKSNLKMTAAGLLIVVVVFLVGAYFIISRAARNGSDKEFVQNIASSLGVSIATINGDSVSIGDYRNDLTSLTHFYNANADQLPPIDAETISDQALSRLLGNKLIEQVMKEYDVSLSKAEIEEERTKFFEQFDQLPEAASQIEEQYGISNDDFFDRVVVPTLKEQKLQEAFVKNLAEEVLTRIKDGEDFQVLAAEFGSDSTREEGGDLGWFKRADMVPEFSDAVFELEPGELSDTLVKTQFGFHILKLDELRNTTSETNDEEVQEARARHILFPVGGITQPPSPQFAELIQDRLKNSTINVYGTIHNPFEDLLNQDT